VFAKVDTLEATAIFSLVLIEILVMQSLDMVLVLAQIIALVLLYSQDQIVLIQFVSGKAQLIRVYVQEMEFVKVQIIANVQLEVTQVLIATSQYVLMSTIVHPMDYALEQTIVLVSLDGRIKIVVHFTVINKTIVHIQKEHAMDQINVIAQVNGLEVIAIHQFATLSVL
jgi:hypothetical protein